MSAVKEIYAELSMKQVFQEYEDRSYAELNDLIESGELPKDMFMAFAKKIYKRDK